MSTLVEKLESKMIVCLYLFEAFENNFKSDVWLWLIQQINKIFFFDLLLCNTHVVLNYFLFCRKCSCDAAELQWRSDAGVISVKDDLAIFSMKFLGNNLVNSTGKITLGKLYCSQKEFGKCLECFTT